MLPLQVTPQPWGQVTPGTETDAHLGNTVGLAKKHNTEQQGVKPKKGLKACLFLQCPYQVSASPALPSPLTLQAEI